MPLAALLPVSGAVWPLLSLSQVHLAFLCLSCKCCARRGLSLSLSSLCVLSMVSVGPAPNTISSPPGPSAFLKPLDSCSFIQELSPGLSFLAVFLCQELFLAPGRFSEGNKDLCLRRTYMPTSLLLGGPVLSMSQMMSLSSYLDAPQPHLFFPCIPRLSIALSSSQKLGGVPDPS